MTIFVKAINDFNDPVYKEISIVEICGKQTVTLSAIDINIDVGVGGSSINVHYVVNSDFFVNSNIGMCPYNNFVIVDENQILYSGFTSVNGDYI